MPNSSKYREFLEKQIISSAFFFPSAAHEMSSILTQGNFSDSLCSKVYAVIRAGMDRGQLSPDSYMRELASIFTDQEPAAMLAYLDSHLIGESVREKCLILVELDMREKFGDALKQNELLAVAQGDFEKATLWKQCYDFITDPKMDVFDSIPKVEKYLSNYAKEELESFHKLQAAIPKMVDRVRGLERSRRMIESLTALAKSEDFESDRRECVEILKDLLVLCVSRLPMPENLSDTLSELKRNSWQLPQKSPVSVSF
jgi:hypothetical protein